MTSILVTRPAGEDDPLAAGLRELGYRVHAVPTVTTEPVGRGSALDDALASVDRYAWVIVTSATGARVVGDRLAAVGGSPLSPPERPKWAAVGPATADALEKAGVPVSVIPPEANGVAIAPAIQAIEPIAGARILLARADAASSSLPSLLRAAGAHVDEVVAYRTIEGPSAFRRAVLGALADPDLAAIVLASGSAVRGLLALAGSARADRVRSFPVVTIGPKTSAVARELGLHVAGEADSPSVGSLIAVVRRVAPPTPLHQSSASPELELAAPARPPRRNPA